jgi:P-type E1-E2 ATPase
VAEARKRGTQVVPPADLQERPGLGVVARVEGEQAVLGRRALLKELGVDPGAAEESDAAEVWVALGTRFLGRILLRDEPRPDARAALAEMRTLGIDRLVLLTGDRAGIAREIGTALGVDEMVADVLPAQKLEVVRAEQAAGRTVMMVGDGVNDALALAGADVGVAIGAEVNEVALGGADVALLGADLGRLPRLVRLADATRSVIGQNVWLAFGFAAVLIALAATGALDPLTGALAQSAAVVVVVVNSARILAFAR